MITPVYGGLFCEPQSRSRTGRGAGIEGSLSVGVADIQADRVRAAGSWTDGIDLVVVGGLALVDADARAVIQAFKSGLLGVLHARLLDMSARARGNLSRMIGTTLDGGHIDLLTGLMIRRTGGPDLEREGGNK
jgi:hypothetical protein